MHTVIDDHSRLAYSEIRADEKAGTAVGVLHRAIAWFAEHGVPTGRRPAATHPPEASRLTDLPGQCT